MLFSTARLVKKRNIQQRPPIKFACTSRLKTVHIDIVGPLIKSTKGNTYLLTMMDRFSRWFEAVPMRNITAENVAEKFFNHWITRFGVPDFLISDQ